MLSTTPRGGPTALPPPNCKGGERGESDPQKTTKQDLCPMPLFHAYSMYPSGKACFEHSNFFKVNITDPVHTQSRAHTVLARQD